MLTKFCTKCVNSNHRPGLTFDKHEVCDACQHAEIKKKINWKLREKELCKLLDQHRSKNGDHDVLVPTSGGKDSTYVAHQLKYVYGMNPLGVSWAPAMYTEVGYKNLKLFADNYDTLVYVTNRETHRKLTRISFEEFGDPFQPFHYGQQSFPVKIAIKYKIPLIIYGENQNVEYGSSKAKKESPFEDMNERYYQQSLRVEAGVDTLIKIGVKKKIFNKKNMKNVNFHDYRLPLNKDTKKEKIKISFFSYFKKWSPQENYYYVKKNCNFLNAPSRTSGSYTKYTSLDDKIDELYFYLQYLKFGFGRASSEACVDIRDGFINREEARLLVNMYDGEYPYEELETVLDYLNMSKEKLDQICEKFRNKKLFVKVNKEYQLKTKI